MTAYLRYKADSDLGARFPDASISPDYPSAAVADLARTSSPHADQIEVVDHETGEVS